MEILWGPFERHIALPANVDVDQIKAFFEAGFLEVVLPKLGKEKPRRVSITVS
jgi:HSP20 family molecular chaperone IbpA